MKKLLFIVFSFLFFYANTQTKKWTLEDCVNYALENNISILQSEWDMEIANVELKGAIGDFLPNLNANIRHSWNTGLSTNNFGLKQIATNQNSSFGINAGIILYNGQRNIRRLHKAKLSILAKQYQLDDMKDNISLNVATAFLEIVFNKESLKTLERQYELSKKQFDRTLELIEAESIPKGDLLEIEAIMASQEQQMINSKNMIQISKINLANMLLIKDVINFEISDEKYNFPPSQILNYKAEEIYKKSLGFRNDIKYAEIFVKMSEYDLKIAKGGYKPTLSGSYGFGTNYFNSDLGNSDSFKEQISDNKRHSFGLSLSIPIFNRFSISNDVKRSKINLEKTKLVLEKSKIDLRDKVNQAYNNVLGSLASYNAAKKTLSAREIAFKYSQDKFEEGLMNSFDFSQAKTRFETAESELIIAKYDYYFKVKVLEFYFGISLEID